MSFQCNKVNWTCKSNMKREKMSHSNCFRTLVRVKHIGRKLLVLLVLMMRVGSRKIKTMMKMMTEMAMLLDLKVNEILLPMLHEGNRNLDCNHNNLRARMLLILYNQGTVLRVQQQLWVSFEATVSTEM